MTPSVETSTLTSASFEDLVREMIVRLGEDPTREGLARTPNRVHRAYEHFISQLGEDTAIAKKEFAVQGVRGLNQKAALLSGGNAQKLVLAR